MHSGAEPPLAALTPPLDGDATRHSRRAGAQLLAQLVERDARFPLVGLSNAFASTRRRGR